MSNRAVKSIYSGTQPDGQDKKLPDSPPKETPRKPVSIYAQNSPDNSTAPVTQPTLKLKNAPSTEDIDIALIKIKREKKVRRSGDIPVTWDVDFRALSKKLKVGKYDLVTYAIGKLLEKI